MDSLLSWMPMDSYSFNSYYNGPADFGQGGITPMGSVLGSHQLSSSMLQPGGLFSPAMPPAPCLLTPEVFCLGAECQAVGSQLAKQFQILSRLEAMHHTMTQATAHETINWRWVERSAAYNVLLSANASNKKCERTLQKLHKEAAQAWKDTNHVVFDQQLRYDLELASFINSAEKMLHAKLDEVWECMQNQTNVIGMPQDTCLCLTLQVLELLPTIPLDISFHAPFPMMLMYGPESYSSQAWLQNEEETSSLGEGAKASHILEKKLG